MKELVPLSFDILSDITIYFYEKECTEAPVNFVYYKRFSEDRS